MAILDITTVPLYFSFCALSFFLLLSNVIYNLYFHPLRHYPGPSLWAASSLPYTFSFASGRSVSHISALHDKYGHIVRVGPNRLSYTHPDAWRDIRGHRKSGQGENGKEVDGFFFFSRHSMLAANREDHSRARRALAHAFSAKAMQAQQDLIVGYVDLFITRLMELVSDKHDGNGTTVDVVKWFNWTTFDIIGDLSFGAPFDCLQTSSYHPWVTTVFNSITQFGYLMAVQRHAPMLVTTLRTVTGLGKPQQEQAKYAEELIKKRLELTTSRSDFVDALTTAKTEEGVTLTKTEIVQNMRLLVLAGSETTATALSATTYFIVTHPDVRRNLARELYGCFNNESEMNLFSVQRLRYMLAVIEESLRCFPPVPAGHPRVMQRGGDMICGRFVPEGTSLDIWPWAMNHSSKNFTSPNEFIPDRWLETDKNGRFANDRRDASQPFSVGPRNCIGKNLAYAELQLILARLLYNFDISLPDQNDDTKQWLTGMKSYNLWIKPPLNITLSPT
ncbi:cytochrome P450 [Bombardia bombarda]|uniref:Cytochrome P450 n=1 Tax=Bombardia bombarda TaxID=252184 RepID=A0AA40C9C6_9PEZI|nr:cytochrome P450 [Bombardia bombarda]